jgi:hypothetical protein
MTDAPGANHPPLDPELVIASYGARGENLMMRS